ncbi:MAG: VWA domain-containing protein [Bryobacteraceae bacterium]
MAVPFCCIRIGVTLLVASVAAAAFQARPIIGTSVIRVRPSPRPTSEDLPLAELHTDASMVLVPAHVTNGWGRAVTNLRKDDFVLLDNGTEQNIGQLFHDDAPVSVGLLFDTSGSMQKKLPRAIEAMGNFIRIANPEDEFFLIQFGERAKLAVSFTPDAARILEAVGRTKPFGRTCLLDAIHLALTQMRSARHLRKALVILSDGGDNRSRQTPASIRNGLLESDVQVYAMGIFDQTESRRLTTEEQNGPVLLGDLTDLSGGQLYSVNSADSLPEISTKISRELRDQYVFGYSPSSPQRDGKYHRIQLRLAPTMELAPDLRLYYRRGYFAPTE